jgi:hypothetical protein
MQNKGKRAMYAIAEKSYAFKGNFNMAAISEKFDWKIQLGSILVGIQLLAYAAMYLISDHQTNAINAANNVIIMQKLEAISMQMPLTNRNIEISANRISQLESQYSEVRDRITQLQQFEATTEQTLIQLRESYSELVAASQDHAPVNRPHGR